MGSPISQVQAPQTNQYQGKGAPIQNTMQQAPTPQGQMDGIDRPIGKGGSMTYPGSGRQPRMGQPNNYSNTVGPWDNATIGTQSPFRGKGKGA